jgi:Protein of unknown function (DUF2508).
LKDKYVKEEVIREFNAEQKKEQIIKSLIIAKKELDSANGNFEMAEGDLIDYYSYYIKACQAKFDYLLKIAKEQGFILDHISAIDIKDVV